MIDDLLIARVIYLSIDVFQAVNTSSPNLLQDSSCMMPNVTWITSAFTLHENKFLLLVAVEHLKFVSMTRIDYSHRNYSSQQKFGGRFCQSTTPVKKNEIYPKIDVAVFVFPLPFGTSTGSNALDAGMRPFPNGSSSRSFCTFCRPNDTPLLPAFS